MKRLFQVTNLSTRRPHENKFFPNKKEAKDERDRLNAISSSASFVVSPGPDHYRFKSLTH